MYINGYGSESKLIDLNKFKYSFTLYKSSNANMYTTGTYISIIPNALIILSRITNSSKYYTWIISNINPDNGNIHATIDSETGKITWDELYYTYSSSDTSGIITNIDWEKLTGANINRDDGSISGDPPYITCEDKSTSSVTRYNLNSNIKSTTYLYVTTLYSDS